MPRTRKTMTAREAEHELHLHLYGQGIQRLGTEHKASWATPEQVAGIGPMLAPLADAWGRVTITARDDGNFRVALDDRPRPQVRDAEGVASTARDLSGPQATMLRAIRDAEPVGEPVPTTLRRNTMQNLIDRGLVYETEAEDQRGPDRDLINNGRCRLTDAGWRVVESDQLRTGRY